MDESEVVRRSVTEGARGSRLLGLSPVVAAAVAVVVVVAGVGGVVAATRGDGGRDGSSPGAAGDPGTGSTPGSGTGSNPAPGSAPGTGDSLAEVNPCDYVAPGDVTAITGSVRSTHRNDAGEKGITGMTSPNYVCMHAGEPMITKAGDNTTSIPRIFLAHLMPTAIPDFASAAMRNCTETDPGLDDGMDGTSFGYRCEQVGFDSISQGVVITVGTVSVLCEADLPAVESGGKLGIVAALCTDLVAELPRA